MISATADLRREIRPSTTESWARRPAVHVLALIAVSTVIKLALAFLQDPDAIETYHWLYARHPAAGYYDHPGMIGWWIWLSTSVFGDSLAAIRLPTILGSAGAIWLAFLAGRRMYDEKAGRLAALLVGMVPLTARFAAEATPDGPLIFFWMTSLWALGHALDRNPGSRSSLGWWILSGIFVGAAIDSKYSAAVLPAGLALYLVLSPDHRFWLARIEPYLAATAALAVFWPTVMWNSVSQWQSFSYQGVERIEASGEFTWSYAWLYLRRQVGLITPVVLLWAVITGVRTAIRWREAPWADRVNACLGLPLLLLFTGLAFFRSVRAHWPVVAYLSLFLMSAAAAQRRGGWTLKLHYVTLGILGVLGIALPAYFATRPADRIRPWEAVAAEVRRRNPSFVLAADYHDAAELAWHLRPLPASDLTPAGVGGKSFKAWWRPDSFIGADAVFVTTKPVDSEDWATVKRYFKELEGPTEIEVAPLGEKRKTFLIWTARSYHPPIWQIPSGPRGEAAPAPVGSPRS